MKALTMKLGVRPQQKMVVTTRDGKTYDLGRQVAGEDIIAKWFQWRQDRKIRAYCRDRLRSLTGTEREEFLAEMNKMKEARRG